MNDPNTAEKASGPIKDLEKELTEAFPELKADPEKLEKIIQRLQARTEIRRKRKKDQLSQDQERLVVEGFIPEIRMIWAHAKAVAGPSTEDSWDEKLKKEALSRFDDSKGGFKFIMRPHLEEKSLYVLSSTREYRDFQGKLLKMMVRTHFGLNIGAQRLNETVKQYREGKREN
jgi:hypothetical protein